MQTRPSPHVLSEVRRRVSHCSPTPRTPAGAQRCTPWPLSEPESARQRRSAGQSSSTVHSLSKHSVRRVAQLTAQAAPAAHSSFRMHSPHSTSLPAATRHAVRLGNPSSSACAIAHSRERGVGAGTAPGPSCCGRDFGCRSATGRGSEVPSLALAGVDGTGGAPSGDSCTEAPPGRKSNGTRSIKRTSAKASPSAIAKTRTTQVALRYLRTRTIRRCTCGPCSSRCCRRPWSCRVPGRQRR